MIGKKRKEMIICEYNLVKFISQMATKQVITGLKYDEIINHQLKSDKNMRRVKTVWRK